MKRVKLNLVPTPLSARKRADNFHVSKSTWNTSSDSSGRPEQSHSSDACQMCEAETAIFATCVTLGFGDQLIVRFCRSAKMPAYKMATNRCPKKCRERVSGTRELPTYVSRIRWRLERRSNDRGEGTETGDDDCGFAHGYAVSENPRRSTVSRKPLKNNLHGNRIYPALQSTLDCCSLKAVPESTMSSQ
jgi:hypothetical protein